MRQHPVARALLAAAVVAGALAGITMVLGWQAGFMWSVLPAVMLTLLWLVAEAATWRWSRRHMLQDDVPGSPAHEVRRF